MDTSNSNVKESALKANAKYSAYVYKTVPDKDQGQVQQRWWFSHTLTSG